MDTEDDLRTPLRQRHVNSSDSLLYFRAEPDDDAPRPNFKGEYVRAFAWCCLLLVGWAVTRGTCVIGVPSDCNLPDQPLEYMSDISLMLIYGLVQAWFCEIFAPKRFWGLFSLRRWFFIPTFLCSSVVFSAVSDISALQCSLSSAENFTALQIFAYGSVGLVASATALWHVYYAWKKLDRARCGGNRVSNFHIYVMSRAGMLAYYGFYTWLVLRSGISYEFHHYWLAWVASTIAMFNHPISVIWLACSAGIFVQGVGAYRAEWLFYAD